MSTCIRKKKINNKIIFENNYIKVQNYILYEHIFIYLPLFSKDKP
jgi:hypothetical protein